jgi:hypothetical protein
MVNDIQQGLRIDGVGITDNGNSSRLRKGIDQRLEPLPKAQRVVAHHALHSCQGMDGDFDITQIIRETSEFQQVLERYEQLQPLKVNAEGYRFADQLPDPRSDLLP